MNSTNNNLQYFANTEPNTTMAFSQVDNTHLAFSYLENTNNAFSYNNNVTIEVERINTLKNHAIEQLNTSNREIETGLSKPNASTGTPIVELNGQAEKLALKANVGGGSVETNGGGTDKGEKIFVNRIISLTVLATLEYLTGDSSNDSPLNSVDFSTTITNSLTI